MEGFTEKMLIVGAFHQPIRDSVDVEETRQIDGNRRNMGDGICDYVVCTLRQLLE
jgi:hypothetical protein